MPRVRKNPDDRITEILDAAAALFAERGFAATPVEAVIERAGISKGAFYHYFPSKDAVLRACVDRSAERIADAMERVLAAPGLRAPDKLRALLAAGRANPGPEGDFDRLHAPENAELRLHTSLALVARLAPLFAGVVAQGVKEGVFAVERPRETSELVLAAGQFLLDDAFFPAGPAVARSRAAAFQTLAERAFGAAPGSLGFLVAGGGEKDR